MNIYYYQVIIASSKFHSQEYLTYSGTEELPIGSIVSVYLKNAQVMAIVNAKVTKPKFEVKEISIIYNLPSLPQSSLDLMLWMKSYYPSSIGTLAQLFLPKKILSESLKNTRRPGKTLVNSSLPELTIEQKQVLNKIDDLGTYLIHGETGTGKTRIYQELAIKAVKNNRSVIVLTPEIGLTSQLVQRFTDIFGDKVLLVHSKLTILERNNIWLEILTSKGPLVVIGTRSAIFSPLRNIGLLIIDESHESAYKNEQAPNYDALRIASKINSINKSVLVFGSATPSVLDYYIAENKSIPILRMTELATTKSMDRTSFHIVDIKDRSEFTRDHYLSDKLIESIKTSLSKGEQSLIFLNRRGSARVVLCNICGWQAICPNCDTPLTYHGDNHTMRCHTCSFKMAAFSSCPVCNNVDIIFKSVGTKSIVDKLHGIFPEARIQRFDTDNAKSERLEKNYQNIIDGNVDILVGTQTLAKGLDLPKLSMVGIVTADVSLYTPDYTAQEKMFQLISQVIGRVGRGHLEGTVILQSYEPRNKIILSALSKDWNSFYTTELEERKRYIFPPYCYLLKLTCRRKSQKNAIKASTDLAEMLKKSGLRIIINGPAPSFHERFGNYFEWQLVIKAKDRNELLNAINLLPANWTSDIDPVNLL